MIQIAFDGIKNTVDKLSGFVGGEAAALAIDAEAGGGVALGVEVEDGLKRALVGRPEILATQYAVDNEHIRYEYWRNQTRPALNLIGSYGYSGLGGTTTIRDNLGNVVSRTTGNLGDSFQEIIDREFKNWSIGLQFSYPILNRAARGAYGAAKYEQLVAIAQRRGVPFEWANMMDGLQAERDQNITIDTAQIWFRTAKREYVIIDAPGHKEFVKNMVTGASRADAALIIIDASEGVQEQTRRHGYLLRLIGVRHVVVVVNKMDLVGYSQATFDSVSTEYQSFLASIGIEAQHMLPVSARQGDNIAKRGANLAWFTGPTVVEALDTFGCEREPEKHDGR